MNTNTNLVCEHHELSLSVAGLSGSLLNNLSSTLITSPGSDTVTSIFKCNSSKTIKSLRLLKMA